MVSKGWGTRVGTKGGDQGVEERDINITLVIG